MHRMAVLGKIDGRFEQFVQPLAAIIGDQPVPRLDRARYGDGVGALGIDGEDAALAVPCGFRRRRRAPRAVIGDHFAAGGRVEDETIAPDPSHLRLDHAEDRGRGDGRIDRVAARAQGLDRRQCGPRVRGGRHRPR